jgi:hypothetical protein
MNSRVKSILSLLLLPAIILAACGVAAAAAQERPIIVCTTNVLGSIVNELVGDQADVVILAQPSICPADYDMKPGDIYAVSRAKILFYHGIRGEYWLEKLLNESGNRDLKLVKIYGDWNTPEGAKRYIRWVAGNLSEALGLNLGSKPDTMIESVDEVAEEVMAEAQSLRASDMNVICMSWQTPFVKWVGFNVVAEYGPPETLSAGFVANLTSTAREEGAALIIDNLQVGVDFGAELAPEVGAAHAVLTNFPGAIPGTGSLANMLKYNAEQLFEEARAWRAAQTMSAQVESLRGQLAVFQAAASIAVVAAVVEAVWLYSAKKRGKS